MDWDFVFFFNSVLLGIALAMDAFSVSIANGLNEPLMKKGKMTLVAGVYAFFQFLMPMIGWVCVHFLVETFKTLEKFVPWVALALLAFLGIKMIVECIKENREEKAQKDAENESAGENAAAGAVKSLSFGTLMVQGIATSIDALSVGFTIENYNGLMAFVASLVIAFVTFIICMGGLIVGKQFGKKFSYAGVLGGGILIAIGLEIFIKGLIA